MLIRGNSRNQRSQQQLENTASVVSADELPITVANVVNKLQRSASVSDEIDEYGQQSKSATQPIGVII